MSSDKILNGIFSYFDLLIQNMPLHYQVLLSLALLLFLLWNIYAFLKSGNWLLVAILIMALPGTWPATRKIALFLWMLIKGLIYRIQG